MKNTDARIDAYIVNAADFAKPILEYVRAIVHETCADVKEDWKWSFPHFMYKGKILCAMTAFKHHCGFGFWLDSMMKTMKEFHKADEKSGMFSLGKLTKIEDLPPKAKLQEMILEAMELTDMGVTYKKEPKEKTELLLPDYFENALKEKQGAWEFFQKSSPSFKKEYLVWITDAKTEGTRMKRLEQAVEWISEGKARNWKYQKC